MKDGIDVASGGSGALVSVRSERAVKDIWIMAWLVAVKGVEYSRKETKRKGSMSSAQAVWYFDDTKELGEMLKEYYAADMEKVRHRIRTELDQIKMGV